MAKGLHYQSRIFFSPLKWNVRLSELHLREKVVLSTKTSLINSLSVCMDAEWLRGIHGELLKIKSCIQWDEEVGFYASESALCPSIPIYVGTSESLSQGCLKPISSTLAKCPHGLRDGLRKYTPFYPWHFVGHHFTQTSNTIQLHCDPGHHLRHRGADLVIWSTGYWIAPTWVFS